MFTNFKTVGHEFSICARRYALDQVISRRGGEEGITAHLVLLCCCLCFPGRLCCRVVWFLCFVLVATS